MLGRVDTGARIVFRMSSGHVGGDASVVLLQTLVIPEDIHKALQHKRAPSKQLAVRNHARSREFIGLGRETWKLVLSGQETYAS